MGKWYFAEIEEAEMRNWVATKWKSLLGYIPTLVRLMGGWYSYHFLSEEDLQKKLVLPWVKGRGFLALHSWYMGFNPLKKMPKNKLIWVKLPGLPTEFWTKEMFTDIDNAIGKFIYVDPRCLGARDKRAAWIII